ncbi:MAG: hypothetical protein HPY76_13340 [Anaerolineae bacterium]|jgi:hypothetical protein|nr:hypothetical protein [Anaerolineae bacterium]
MLNQVLREIEAASGAVELGELKRRLGIDRGALEGMIQFWVRKGRLVDDQGAGVAAAHTGGSCGSSCAGYDGCAFIAKMPRTYSLPPEK